MYQQPVWAPFAINHLSNSSNLVFLFSSLMAPRRKKHTGEPLLWRLATNRQVKTQAQYWWLAEHFHYAVPLYFWPRATQHAVAAC
jgi:hypothetical protein